MNANLEKLISALESGQYEKGEKKLRQDDRYCAWGVACDLFMRETGRGRWEQVGYGVARFVLDEDRGDSRVETTSPPLEVEKWFGLEPGQAVKIIRWNDGYNDPKVVRKYVEYVYVPSLSFPELAIKLKEEFA